MVNLVLAGALGGLGKGLTQVGEDILKRREQALEWAQREALYQRSLRDKREDTEESRRFQAEQTVYNQDRIDARAAAGQQAMTERQTASREYQHGETVYREDRQDARTTATQNRIDRRAADKPTKAEKDAEVGMARQEKEAAGANLRDLQTRLGQIDTPASKRLQMIIQQSKDLIGLRYGKVGQNNRAPVFGVTKLGKLKYLGFDIDNSLVNPPKDDEGL